MPRVAADEPLQQRRAAIVEFGLPYPADPAITRHVAAFLRRHAQRAPAALADRRTTRTSGDEQPPARQGLPVPDTLLFNGGVFRAEALAERLQPLSPTGAARRCACCTTTIPTSPSPAAQSPTRSSARARATHRWRLGAQLLPGPRRRQQAATRHLPAAARQRGRARNPPARAHLQPAPGSAGTLLPRLVGGRHALPARARSPTLDDEDFVRLPPIATVVQAQAGSSQREVRVQLITAMTEVGTLELHCVSSDNPARRWLLEFQLRGDGAERRRRAEPAGALCRRRAVHRAYLRRPARSPSTARRCGACAASSSICSASATTGRCRCCAPSSTPCCNAPGGGGARRSTSGCGSTSPATACARASATRSTTGGSSSCASCCPQGIQYVNESQNWSEWWTLWRRAAGGLPADTRRSCSPNSLPALRSEPSKPAIASRQPIAGSHDDMLRLVASLERLPSSARSRSATGCSTAAQGVGEAPRLVGARPPRRAPVALRQRPPGGSARSRRPLARSPAGRGLEEGRAGRLRRHATRPPDRRPHARPARRPFAQAVLARLSAINASATGSSRSVLAGWTVVELDKADERRAFGESLPAGLRLASSAVRRRRPAPASGRPR
jgi:hypothetical protein